MHDCTCGPGGRSRAATSDRRPPPQADRPHLDRRLPRRPAVRLRHRRLQRRRRPDGQGARAVPAPAGRRHQLAHIRRRGRCPHRREDLRRHRPPEDDPAARGAVLRRRPVRRLLARLRDPGGRPDHSRARGRGCLDSGPGLPCGAGTVRDPRIDHRPQRVGDRRRAVRCLRRQRDPRRHPGVTSTASGASCSGSVRCPPSRCSSACCGCPSRRAGWSRRAATTKRSRCSRRCVPRTAPSPNSAQVELSPRTRRKAISSASRRSWPTSGCGASSSSASVSA